MMRRMSRVRGVPNATTVLVHLVVPSLRFEPPTRSGSGHILKHRVAAKLEPEGCHWASRTILNGNIRHLSIFSQTRFRKASQTTDPTKEDHEEFMSKGDKVLRVKLSTTRLDAILKTGLQISKNKIEKAFYEDRIRLNGGRPKKKSQLLVEGDEVDLVRGPNRNNPAFLDVSRVEVVQLGDEESLEEEEESDSEGQSRFPAVIKRYKSLTIENYEEAWKGTVESS